MCNWGKIVYTTSVTTICTTTTITNITTATTTTITTTAAADAAAIIEITERKKTPRKMENQHWFLLHCNAPAHRSDLFKDFLAKNNVTTLEFPSYSPDLPAADF